MDGRTWKRGANFIKSVFSPVPERGPPVSFNFGGSRAWPARNMVGYEGLFLLGWMDSDLVSGVGFMSCRSSARTAAAFSVRAACPTSFRCRLPSSQRRSARPATRAYCSSTLQRPRERRGKGKKGKHFLTSRLETWWNILVFGHLQSAMALDGFPSRLNGALAV